MKAKSAVLLPLLVAILFLLAWDAAVRMRGSELFPKPVDVWWGLVELVRKGLLVKYVVASLFRVTWGFTLAVLVGIPFGLLLGWSRPAHQACAGAADVGAQQRAGQRAVGRRVGAQKVFARVANLRAAIR